MTERVGFLTMAAALLGLLVITVLGYEARWILNVFISGVFVGWGLIILTLPWNLYFEARSALAEYARSEKRGIHPELDRSALTRIRDQTLAAALSAHLVSAAGIGAFAFWSSWPAGGAIAAVLAVSTTFRPIHAWYRSVWAMLMKARAQIRVPRQDAVTLHNRLEKLEKQCRSLEADNRTLQSKNKELSVAHEETRAQFQQRVEQLGRKFEQSLEQLTDNKELLAGIRAFLKMVQAS